MVCVNDGWLTNRADEDSFGIFVAFSEEVLEMWGLISVGTNVYAEVLVWSGEVV